MLTAHIQPDLALHGHFGPGFDPDSDRCFDWPCDARQYQWPLTSGRRRSSHCGIALNSRASNDAGEFSKIGRPEIRRLSSGNRAKFCLNWSWRKGKAVAALDYCPSMDQLR